MSNGGIVTQRRHCLRAANLLRNASAQFSYNTNYGFFQQNIRGKIRQAAKCANDPDNCIFRARRSKGWKSRKHRYQWEHNYIEADKHEKSRHRKAVKRASRCSPQTVLM